MNWKRIVFLAVGVIFLSVLLFFLIRKIFSRIVDKKIAGYQNTLLGNYYDEVENMYRQMRGWRHDFHNQIQTIDVLLKQRNLSQLEQYLIQLDQNLMTIDTVLKTGNVMADAVLNSKISFAKNKEIKVSAKAQVPADMRTEQVDFCAVLGNLLDNAIQSCEKIQEKEKRFIRIYIGPIKGQLYISVSNAVGHPLRRRGKEYLSTRGANHGFGLKRVDSIVKKYGGFINRQDEGDVFATELMFPL